MAKVTGSRSPRWAFMSPMHIFAEDGQSYLRRMRIIETPLFGVFLHHIDSPDKDFDPHDHPWNFLSCIVRGGYTERVWPKAQVKGFKVEWAPYHRVWKRWSWHKMTRDSVHKIIEAKPRTITLILHGRRHRDGWGFYPESGFVDWQSYKAVHGAGSS